MTTDVSAVSSQADRYATTLTNQWSQFLGSLQSLLGTGIALNFNFGGSDPTVPPVVPVIDSSFVSTQMGPVNDRLYSYQPMGDGAFTEMPPSPVPDIDDATISLNVEAISENAPQLAPRTAPNDLTVAPPTNAPAVTDVGEAPSAPTLSSIGPAPTFDTIDLPELETISFEAFTGVAPTDLPAPSQTAFSFVEQPYVASMLTAIEAKLLNDLQNGGYGIDTLDEQRLWERVRDREALSLQAQLDEITRLSAARGFSYPPGAMYALQQAALQEYTAKTSSVSRDIMSKKADLYVQNRQFTISQAKEVEQLKMNYHSAMMERALKTAQLTVELGISAYNAAVVQYRAKVDFYKAQVEIWVQKRQAEMYKVEVFKAKVQAEMAKAQINQAKVDQYKAQISVVQNQVLLYDTQIKAYRSRIEAQQSLILAFKNQVDLYRAQVEGKQLELNVFKAELEGDLAQVALYKAKVDGHNGYMQAKVAEANVKETAARVKVQNEQLKLEAYKTDLARYQALLARDQAILGRDFSNEQLYMNARTAQAQTLVQAANLALQANKVNIDTAIEMLKIRAGYVISSGNVWSAFLRMKGEVAGQGARAVQDALNGAYGMLSGITAEIK